MADFASFQVKNIDKDTRVYDNLFSTLCPQLEQFLGPN